MVGLPRGTLNSGDYIYVRKGIPDDSRHKTAIMIIVAGWPIYAVQSASVFIQFLSMGKDYLKRDVIRMTIDKIREAVLSIVGDYPIKSVILFGSRAAGTDRDDSDVDLIMEFTAPVTLLILADIKFRLEDILGLGVDIVHGPLRETDIIEIDREIDLYTA